MKTTENIHIWQRCHGCGSKPIVGPRFHCENCPDGPDNDLCGPCYAQYHNGSISHPPKDNYHSQPPKGAHRFTQWEGNPDHQYESWLLGEPPSVPSPEVPDGFLIRPEFCAGYDSCFAGYGFAVTTPRGPLVLTALHTMDELIKLKGIDTRNENSQYTGREIPAFITRVHLYDVLKEKWMLHSLGEAEEMVVLPEARTHHEEPYSQQDIAAFRARTNDFLKPCRLAPQTPGWGEPVWLAANLPGQRRTLEAMVVEKTDRCFVFRFEQGEEGPKYSSGAPILNRAGEVVGINVGEGCYRDRLFGHANHVESIRRHLASELN